MNQTKQIIVALLPVLLAACGKPAPTSFESPDVTRSNVVAVLASESQPVWPTFRGPDQGRAAAGATPPLFWSERTNITWKTELPGSGNSSPILARSNIWLTTSLDEGRSLHVLAADIESGSVVFDREVFKLEATPAKHRVNNPASPTAVADAERLYVSFGTYGLACLRLADREMIWTNTELKFDDEQMGPGASLILADDKLIVSCDGTDTRFIAALDAQTGKVAWKTERSNPIAKAIPFRKAFSTPLQVTLHGVDQILSSSSYRLFSYEPKTGRELWAVEIPGFCPIPVPSVRSNWVFVCTGYNRAELWAFKVGNKGNEPERMWKISRSVPLISSPVLADDHLFMVSQEGIASCIDALSGEIRWNERLGGAYWASPIYADGKVFFFAENGTSTVLAASTEFKPLAKNTLDGEIMATPAFVGNSIFLRTKTHLYRLDANLEP
jgi:outer membrane protein assembly factor BamB